MRLLHEVRKDLCPEYQAKSPQERAMKALRAESAE